MADHGPPIGRVSHVHQDVSLYNATYHCAHIAFSSHVHPTTALVSLGGMLWISTSMGFFLVYWSTSIAINVMLTLGIVGFLVYMRFQVRRVMGPHHARSLYVSVSAMLIESALLYTVSALAFSIPLASSDAERHLGFFSDTDASAGEYFV